MQPIVADGETKGWFDQGRDGGYIRRANSSYLAENGDAFVPIHVVRQIGLRRGDLVEATTGRDQRGRTVVAEVKSAVPVAVLSNTNKVHWDAGAGAWPLLDLFDHAFLSFEIGMVKPDEVFVQITR